MSALSAFVVPVCIGLSLVLLAWPGSYRRDLGLKIALALGFGPGIVSCLYFAWCLFLRPRSRFYFLAEALLLIFLIGLVWMLRRREPEEYSRPAFSRWDRTLCGIFGVFLVLAVARFIQQILMQPHGIQDAWNIWNMRARFLFRGGPAWTDLFSTELYWLNHADYPFLLTAGVARAWSFIGSETVLVPALQAGFYALSLIGVVFFGVAKQRGWGQAALAGIALTSPPIFVLLSGWQIADVPLALWMTVTILLLNRIALTPSVSITPGQLALFGLASGLAAWTKNEGIPWLLLAITGWAVIQAWRHFLFRRHHRHALWILAGAALPLLVLGYLKLALAPSSDLFADQTSASMIQRLLEPQRLAMTGAYIFRALFGDSPIGLQVVPMIPIMAGLFLLFYPHNERKTPASRIIPGLVLLMQGIVYIAIYLITPHDLVWHLRTSVDRLVFHLTPPLILLVFSRIRILPEQA